MTRILGSRYGIIAPLILLSLLVFYAFSYISASAAAEERGSISVTFNEPIAIDSVVKKVKEKGAFDLASAQGRFSVDGSDIHDFVTIIPGESDLDVQTQWSNGRKLLVEQLRKDRYFKASAQVQDGSFAVENVTIYGEKATILEIAASLPGNATEFRSSTDKPPKPDRSPRPQSVSPIDGVVALAAANSPYYLSLPAFGSVTTGLFTAPGVTTSTRGAVNYMTWNSHGFASDQTYEHDFFLNTSGGTYFARNLSLPPYCQPQAVYAATSWPTASVPYLDSDLEQNGLCTSSGNIAFSIGAAQASAITTGTQHFTAILMPNGDASTDTALIQGQIGYRNPVSCTSTLCSFPYGYAIRETTHYNFVVNGAVPGSRSWTNVGYLPDTPDNVSVTNPTVSSLRLNFRDITWDETNIIAERRVGISGTWSVFNFGILNAGNAPGNWYWNNNGLAPLTTYCYRMRTANAKGNSPYSPVICGTTQ